MRLRIRSTPRVGVALGRDRMWAIPLGGRGEPDGRDLWSCNLTPAPAGGWSDLAAGLLRLQQELGAEAGRLHFALLPPLVQVRRIELPRLADDTLRQVLTRDASRYFPGVRCPQVIGIRRLTPGRRSPMPYLVTIVDAPVVESLWEATTQAGWSVESVVSSYSAWETGARRLWPDIGKDGGLVVVRGGECTEALQLDRGRLALVRRFAGADESTQVNAIVGDSQVPTLCRQLESPELLAALTARKAAGPALVPDRVRNETQARSRRLSTRLLTAAAALLLLTAGLEAWGAHRELAEVQGRRAALKENVAKAMLVREEMGQLDARLRVLAGAEAGRSRWARTLVSVAEYLPSDAYLVAFRGSADSVVLEGEGKRAGVVFESLQRAPGVLSVRADAPIRQEARDSGPAIERFTLAARLAAVSVGDSR